MFIIEILYIIAALIAVAACLPQILQLRSSKASDELSLSTWVIWLATQFITLLYVVSLQNMLMAAVNILWTTFYVIMVVMIIHYRHFYRPPPVALQPEEIQ